MYTYVIPTMYMCMATVVVYIILCNVLVLNDHMMNETAIRLILTVVCHLYVV